MPAAVIAISYSAIIKYKSIFKEAAGHAWTGSFFEGYTEN